MIVETIDMPDEVIEIHHDEYPESPRDWDNLGTMICSHRQYKLGDKHNIDFSQFENANELEKYLYDEYDALVVLPLYLLDHSGLFIRTSRFHEDPQGWDTSMIGFIYASKQNVKKNFLCKGISENIKTLTKTVLENEIRIYNQYLSGAVYGYMRFKKERCDRNEIHLTETDSCWGFYGIDDIKSKVQSLLN